MTARRGACDHLIDQLADYFDDEASEAICRAVEEHMAACEDCTAMINTLRKTIDIVRAQPEGADLPDEVRLRLFRRLALEDLAHPPRPGG